MFHALQDASAGFLQLQDPSGWRSRRSAAPAFIARKGDSVSDLGRPDAFTLNALRHEKVKMLLLM